MFQIQTGLMYSISLRTDLTINSNVSMELHHKYL